MTIYRGQDGKILRDSTGDILKEFKLDYVDIDSEYNSKDASNNVSSIDNRYTNTRLVQGNLADRPTENGDGIIFVPSSYLIGQAPNINYSENFTFEMWVKFISPSSYQDIFSIDRFGSDSSDRFTVQLWGGVLTVRINIGSSAYDVGTFDLDAGNWIHLFVVVSKEKSVSIYRNGVLTTWQYPVLYTKTSQQASKMAMGRMAEYANHFNGAIRKIKMYQYYEESLVARNSSGSPQNYIVGQQVFVPPTYPNTILP